MNDAPWSSWSIGDVDVGLLHVGASGLRIVMIALGAWLIAGLLQRAIRRVRLRLAQRMTDRESIKRAETLGRALRYTVGVVVGLLAFLLILGELGVSVAPLLGAAGVAGVAIGFGAQTLVRDYLSGLFLLLEDQLHQGDVVKLDDHAGLVEEVTLRYVRLRDYDGHVHFVPNGRIGAVVNLSRGHAQAVVDVGVGKDVDLDRAMAVMVEVARELRADPAFASRILDDFELAGVERWEASAVVLRGRFKVAPLEQWAVRREYLRRLKIGFDAAGIDIPYPQLTLHMAEGWRLASAGGP
jgi:small conductance mechanosensitive channel